MANTWNPSICDPKFEEFIVLLLADFVDRDRDEMLICPIRTVKKYFSRMEQFHFAFSSLFISMSKKKKRVS